MKALIDRLLVTLLVCLLLAGLVPAFAADPKPPEWTVPPVVPEKVVAAADLTEADVVDWSHVAANLPKAWAKGVTGKGAVVGVIDTGANTRHVDLADQLLSAKDYTRSRFGAEDVNGHGTWCISHVVGALNGKGIRGGAYGAKGRAYKALGDSGSGSVLGIAQAIYDAVEDGCDVLSMSLGGPEPDEYTLKAIRFAVSKGVIVIAAAGNNGPAQNTVGFPGGFAAGQIPVLVCVAAHDRDGKTATFSSRGKAVVCTHGGVSTRAAWVGGVDKYATISGTSMATPGVAAVALLWVEDNPAVKREDRPAAFLKDLIAACDSPAARTTDRGYGALDADKLIRGGTPPKPDPKPDPKPTPAKLNLGWADLNPEARKRLAQAGYGEFNLVVGPTPFADGPVAPAKAKGYSACLERVDAGAVAYLSVGQPAIDGDYQADALPGVQPGRYRCWKEGGQRLMQLTQPTAVTPPATTVGQWVILFGSPYVTPGCVNGRCFR